MIIRDPLHAQDLPSGSLWVIRGNRRLPVMTTALDALKAAEIAFANNDKTDFISRAHLIAHVGINYKNDSRYDYEPKVADRSWMGLLGKDRKV